MINAIIRWSIHNRFLVLLITAMLVAFGLFAVARTPLDAIPDLSDVQVIIKTSYPGQAPQVVEDQVTYPLPPPPSPPPPPCPTCRSSSSPAPRARRRRWWRTRSPPRSPPPCCRWRAG